MFARHTSSSRRSINLGGRLRGSLAACALIAAAAPTSALAAPTPMVDLGQASSYAVLAGPSVGNTVSAPGAPHTTVRGDLGVKANTAPSGFPPGEVTGEIRFGSSVDEAHADLVTAYTEVAARTGGAPLPLALAGRTILPGLHTIPGAASNTTTVTLDGGGNPNAVFVFQVNGALAFAAGSEVKLVNGAQASRVFWQVNGAGAVGANAKFAGTLMALNAVGIGAGTQVNGRAMARDGALSLDSNEFYSGPPGLAIDGGAVAYTTDTTPTISGTTGLESPGLVTVTIAGQTLTDAPSPDGAWSVDSGILPNGTYVVEATATDAVGNESTVTQQLTVDTVLPVVAIDGGSALSTNDPTPTISGTSDAAVDTVVHVTVDSQELRALVHAGGAWNIRPVALGDGTYTVDATVTDPAGNDGAATQTLTVDSTAPAVSINGGANALTNDATPTVSGTAAVPPGSIVTVTLPDEILTAAVQAGGSWSVVAAALPDGPHRIVMSVADPAGNGASFAQRLTVDTVAPGVTIAGGASSTSSDPDPTITGSSDAAPGTTVTVTIAGQTMTTLLQGNGTWNATPTFVGPGTWPVVASVTDPAGNIGSADQSLTIAAGAAPGPNDPTPTDPSPPDPTDPGPADTKAPDTTIKGPGRVKQGDVAKFRFRSSEPDSTFRCKVGRKPFKDCGSSRRVKTVRLAAGTTVKIKVVAVDAAGNADASPAKIKLAVR